MHALSPAAEQFLRANIATLLHLELLLLLRHDPRKWFSAERLAAELRASVESIGRALDDLASANLVDVRIASRLMFRFAPLVANAIPLLDEIAASAPRIDRPSSGR